ncbi:fibronectin type III domain-containing protein [Actinoplanes sp. NPDC048967]|uniref:RCC1 domain-containing protein n=1 Tax=Actinoplanes sp. NPDC048967 TaxID=3155269 RepID=UPI0034036F3E
MWIFTRRLAGVVAAAALVPLWPAAGAEADPGPDAVRAAQAEVLRLAGLALRPLPGPLTGSPAARSVGPRGERAVGPRGGSAVAAQDERAVGPRGGSAVAAQDERAVGSEAGSAAGKEAGKGTGSAGEPEAGSSSESPVDPAVGAVTGWAPGPSAAEAGPGAGLTAVGGRHTCAVVQYSDLWCWGGNDHGQLGDGTTRDSARPVRVTASGKLTEAARILAVHSGRVHTCALTLEYAAMGLVVYCWGGNDEGQLGDGSFADRPRPAQVAGNAVQVVTGAEHTCVLDIELTVSCWGRNDAGQLGFGTLGTSEANPQQVPGLTGVIDLAAGEESTCALEQSGKVWCWGSDSDGQLGDGGGAGDPAPSPVAVGGGPYTEISVGRRHACALGPKGAAYCWGAGDRGQLGRGGDRSAPRRAGSRVYSGLRAGGDSTCGLTGGGAAYCWGANDHGQLAVGGSTDRASAAPVDRSGIRTSTLVRLLLGRPAPIVTDLSVGADRSCAVDVSQAVYCTREGVLRAVPLAPGAVTGVRALARPGGLQVSWAAPAAPGADRIAAYVAVAFTGRTLDGGRSCTARPARTCTVTGLTGGRRYTVVVAAVSHGGVSFSALGHGTPQAAGAGLPVTGPGPLAAAGVVLLAAGWTVRRAGRSVGCRHRIPGAVVTGPGGDDATAR